MKTAIGVFRPEEAPLVVDELRAHGLDEDALNVIAPDRRGAADELYAQADDTITRLGSQIHALHHLDIDGLGPAMVAGPLIGRVEHDGHIAKKELESELVDLGLGRERTAAFFSMVEEGDTLVAAIAEENDLDAILAIMRKHFDSRLSEMLRERREEPRAEAMGGEAEGEDVTTLSVAEERLRVGKRDVEHGVHARTVVTEKPVEETVSLHDERIDVERRPVDESGAARADLFQEKDIEIRARGEEAVVAKEPHVIEEVAIRKQAEEKTETVHATLRRQDVEIEPIEEYRAHFEKTRGEGERFEDAAPAYRYGAELRRDEAHGGKRFEEIEPAARERWESDQPSSWDRFRERIRHAFERNR